jgi:hypothetical protein
MTGDSSRHCAQEVSQLFCSSLRRVVGVSASTDEANALASSARWDDTMAGFGSWKTLFLESNQGENAGKRAKSMLVRGKSRAKKAPLGN